MAERHSPMSPLPWRVEVWYAPEYASVYAGAHEFGRIENTEAEAMSRADAEYIVTACNLYPELIAALRDVLPLAVDLDDCDHANRYCNCTLRAVIERARAVLAKADHAAGEER